MSEPEEEPGECPAGCAYCERMARADVDEGVTGTGIPEDPLVIHVD